jgi:hypothetical protein
MKKIKKICPIFLSLCVALASAPQAALAQAIERVAAEASVSPAAASAAALTHGPALAGVTTLSAPSPSPSPSVSLAPAAASFAAPAPVVSAPAFSAEPVSAPAADAADARYRIPGPAATGVAAEAAAYATEHSAAAVVSAPARVSVAASAPSKNLFGRFADAMRGAASFSSIFDGAAAGAAYARPAPPVVGRLQLKEQKPLVLPNGTSPDEQPTTPSPDREQTVLLQSYDLPGARSIGGILETNRRILQANPEDAAAVVASLKSLIDADRARYGVASSDLRLVHAKKIAGQGDQADALFVVFRQMKDGLLVHGSSLSFTLKVIGGNAQIVAQTGQIFPQLDVDTTATMSDADVHARIAERLGATPQEVADQLKFAEEKIIYSQGSWRHVKLYVTDGLPVMVAVDMASGLVFIWDNRAGVRMSDGAEGSLDFAPRRKKKDGDNLSGGSVVGKTVDHGPISPTAKISSLPLSFLNITVGGKTYTTDKDGRFTAAGLQIAPEGLTLSATLSGPYVIVQDESGKTLTVNLTLKPGDGAVQVIFNPAANVGDENALAQVSAFHKVNFAYNFLKTRGLTTERMDKNAIFVKTNLDEECNAYYTPGSPSLNFFKSSVNCVNSAYDTVADHEYGHYWDDMTGGIMNGGLSEGWGDTLSMYSLNNPVVGEHFLKNPGPDGKDYIRDGRNTYKYNEYDEVHAQGQAWQGFNWKLRAAMMQKLGDAAGAAMAEALVLPTMFAKAATIPDAIAQVLVNAMKKDGTLAFEKDIRAIALLHGVTLPQSPAAGLVSRFVDAVTAPLRRLSADGLTFDAEPNRDEAPASGIQVLQAAAPAAPSARVGLRYSAGAAIRGQVAREIRKHLDAAGVKYELHEYKGWLSSDFLLVIEGPEDQVRVHAQSIQNWLAAAARS